MLRPVLILLLVASIERSSGQGGIVFPSDDDVSCTLKNGEPGQCLRHSECGSKYSERISCGFSRDEPLVCCDVVRRQCEDIRDQKSLKVSDHLVGDVKEAVVGEFPFMALITFKRKDASAGTDDEDLSRHRCGAALVSSRFLLTAAHCFPNSELEPYTVKLGTNDATDVGADTYAIDAWWKHDQYKPMKKQNDIGIIRLKTNVSLNDNVKPICIYTNPEDLSESIDLTVMGWGVGNNEEVSNNLLKGTVQPVPRTTCQKRFDEGNLGRIRLQDTHICALGQKNEEGKTTDTCQGDSGGPMVLNHTNTNHLVAIVSYGPGCGGDFYAGIYTRVSKFLPWIIQKGVLNV